MKIILKISTGHVYVFVWLPYTSHPEVFPVSHPGSFIFAICPTLLKQLAITKPVPIPSYYLLFSPFLTRESEYFP